MRALIPRFPRRALDPLIVPLTLTLHPFLRPQPLAEALVAVLKRADKVKQLVSKTLEGDAASPKQVAQRLRAFSARGLKILKQNDGSKRVMTFKVAPTRGDPEVRRPYSVLSRTPLTPYLGRETAVSLKRPYRA